MPMPKSCPALLALLLVAAPPAHAEPGDVIATTESDIDGDGKADTFRLIDADGSATLEIGMGSGQAIVAKQIAWVGGIGQRPEFAVTKQGSVKVISMNEAIGRNRWHLTLTLAHRRGAVRVAGFTWHEYDTLDLDAWMECDLNLLSGRGLRKDAKGQRQVKAGIEALPVTEWNHEKIGLPKACG